MWGTLKPKLHWHHGKSTSSFRSWRRKESEERMYKAMWQWWWWPQRPGLSVEIMWMGWRAWWSEAHVSDSISLWGWEWQSQWVVTTQRPSHLFIPQWWHRGQRKSSLSHGLLGLCSKFWNADSYGSTLTPAKWDVEAKVEDGLTMQHRPFDPFCGNRGSTWNAT